MLQDEARRSSFMGLMFAELVPERSSSRWRSVPKRQKRGIDIHARGSNNCRMSRSEVVRRVKSYSSATGYVFQYYFYETQKVRRGGAAGTEDRDERQYAHQAIVDPHWKHQGAIAS